MNGLPDIKPWFKEDIIRTLQSLTFASGNTATPPRNTREQGWQDAMASIAAAIGCKLEDVTGGIKR